MAIVTIKYDLNEAEDRKAMMRAMYSLDMASFIFEVLLNGKKRFRDCESADMIWDWLWEQAKNNNIDIEQLIE